MKAYLRSSEIAVVEDKNVVIIMVPGTGMIHELDEVASSIWSKIPESGSPISIEQIAVQLTDEYDVEYGNAVVDINNFVQCLVNESIVTEYD